MGKWEYLVAEFSQVQKKGMGIPVKAGSAYFAQFENGLQIKNWEEGSTFRRYLEQVGEDDWELAGNGPPKHGGVTCVFKRPKE